MKSKIQSTINLKNKVTIKKITLLNKIRIALTLATILFMACALSAQQPSQCATMHNLTRLEKLDPGLREKMQVIETQTQQILNSPANRTSNSRSEERRVG